LETRFLCKDGSVRHIEMGLVNMVGDPVINGVLLNIRNITDRKIREEEILYLTYHDSLTGLNNRIFFEGEKQRLDNERYLPLSFIVGDINGLKIINDALGHAEGDKLLAAIAGILKDCCRQNDVVTRTGGDDFSILLPNTGNDAAQEIIRRIMEKCTEFNKNDGNEISCLNISLGHATKMKPEELLEDVMKVAGDNMNKRKLLESRSLHSAIISSMKAALYEKSQETEEHARRLISISRAVGQAIGLSEQQFDELELLSTLHDIGKIGIDDRILNKPDKLTEDEWVEMKRHSEVGYRIAIASPELMPIAEYILAHHERWDGKGYPLGLAGESIPLLSRILAVADAYDAMTEDRPYRKGMSEDDAVIEIQLNSGSQFDPFVAETFIKIISKPRKAE
ncbi:MAG: diguanylate cyclase, partial [Clostridiales bacterium]|nr:diguanylate cyclase [Clostridiales bacterium]